MSCVGRALRELNLTKPAKLAPFYPRANNLSRVGDFSALRAASWSALLEANERRFLIRRYSWLFSR